MSEQFQAGLRDLYDATAARPDARLDAALPRVVVRARRGRALRGAGVTLATAAAVVGVAVGGSAVVRELDGPTTPPAVGPTRVTDAGLVCGAALPDVDRVRPREVTLLVSLDDGVAAPGRPLPARVDHTTWSDDAEGFVPPLQIDLLREVTFVVVQDDVVVAGASWEREPARETYGRGGYAVAVTPVPCDGSAALPPGRYDLYAAVAGWFSDGPGELEQGLVLSAPRAFRVEGPPAGTGATGEPDRGTAVATPPAPDGAPLRDPGEHLPADGSSDVPVAGSELVEGDYFAVLTGVDVAAGTVDVDVAVFYSGQAAVEYLATHHPEQENPPPNGYWIANDSPVVRTLPLADDVRVWDWCRLADGGLGFAERTPAEWAAAPAMGEQSCDAGPALGRGGDEVYWLQVRGGVVERVIGQYLP